MAADGSIVALTDDEMRQLEAEEAAWAARPLPPREATGSQIYAALDALGAASSTDMTGAWNKAVAAQKPAYQAYWASGYRDRMPETNGKLAKIAKAAGVDLKALYDSAVTQAP